MFKKDNSKVVIHKNNKNYDPKNQLIFNSFDSRLVTEEEKK